MTLLALAYAAALSCGGMEGDAVRDPSTASGSLTPRAGDLPPGTRVVVVAIDGVRWQDVFGGTDAALLKSSGMRAGEAATAEELVPNIRALARNGVAFGDRAHPFSVSGPNFVSLPGYTEMLTGRPSACQENDCDVERKRTLADDIRDLPGVETRDVAIITSWERIDAVASIDPSRISVSAGRTHGATRAVFESDPQLAAIMHSGEHADAFPGHDDYRPDRETAALATAYFERERPRFMFVALGDTDEFGHEKNYRAYVGALRRADQMVGELVRTAHSWGPEGDDVVFVVTTDHGRCDNFKDHGRDCAESSRSWLVASGGPIEAGAQASGMAAHHLRDMAPTMRSLLGIRADVDADAGVAMSEILPAGPRLIAATD